MWYIEIDLVSIVFKSLKTHVKYGPYTEPKH